MGINERKEEEEEEQEEGMEIKLDGCNKPDSFVLSIPISAHTREDVPRPSKRTKSGEVLEEDRGVSLSLSLSLSLLLSLSP